MGTFLEGNFRDYEFFDNLSVVQVLNEFNRVSVK
jgi:hypothetical protein